MTILPAVRTWAEARNAAISRLKEGAAPATAVLDAGVLLAFALGVSKEELLAHPERAMPLDDDARFRSLVDRRSRGEPVAYLRGWKEFYGLRFRVDPRVLIPRPETETLVDEARRAIGGRAVIAADIGTGSGAIACAVAVHEPKVRVIATDVSHASLSVAAENVRELGVADRVELREGDLLVPIREEVDVLCANLPYLREEALSSLSGDRTSLAFEPRGAVVAGPDGLALIRRAMADLPRVLRREGVALFECDPPQAAAIADLASAAGLGARVIRDLAGAERVVAVRASGSGTR